MNGLLRIGRGIAITALLILVLSMPLFASNSYSDKNTLIRSIQSTATGIEANLQIPEFNVVEGESGIELSIEGAYNVDSPIPTVLTCVAVPEGVALHAELVTLGNTESTGLILNTDTEIPSGVQIGEAFMFKGLHLVPLNIPLGTVSENNELEIASEYRLDVFFEGEIQGDSEPIHLTGETERTLRAMVLNLDEVNYEVVAPVGRLLIVMQNDSFLDEMENYIKWKTHQGYKVQIAYPSNPSSYYSVQAVIESHYNSNDVLPLEYVLIVGDQDGTIAVSGYQTNALNYNTRTDHYYSQIEGNDILADLAIGRFSVRNTTELRTCVNKVLSYERDVQRTGTWLNRACLTAGQGSGISPVMTIQAAKLMYDDRGIVCDTLYYTMPGHSDSEIPNFIVNQMNAGAHFVNYRGYHNMSGWFYSQTELLAAMNNYNRLPVVITLTCGTGTWGEQSQAISEGFLRTGSPNSPKGAVACIGTATTGTHTRYNNIVHNGIMEGMLVQNIRSLGWALVFGKYRLWQAFDYANDYGGIEAFSHWNNLMGDPALRVWVGAPSQPTVTHDLTIPQGQNYVDVHVAVPGGWPEMIWATIATDDEVIDSKRFDEDGNVRLFVDDPAAFPDFKLTVVGDNVVPYQETIACDAAQNHIGFHALMIDDGDTGDGEANPGETIILDLMLKNFGETTTETLNGSITSNDPRVVISDGGTFTVAPLDADQITSVETAVTFDLAGNICDGEIPDINVTIGSSESAIILPITSWVISATEAEGRVDEDGDHRVMPGETVDISFAVKNVGHVTASNMTGNLTTDDEGVTITGENLDFGFLAVDIEGNNDSDPFSISVDSEIPIGTKIEFTLTLQDSRGALDSTNYHIFVGDPRVNGVTGPDEFGYWAVDDNDASMLVAPTFQWVDIAQSENRLNLDDTWDEDDETIVIDLPFSFMFYGEVYNEISVCTNGWAALGNHATLTFFRNWPIPSPITAPSMLAPFLDDLRTSGGGVYADYLEGTGQFIITWDCQTAFYSTAEEFQIILYDPAIWGTTTGNGQILFQYEDVQMRPSASSDIDYATVGIQNPTRTGGLQYYYYTTMSPGASQITDGRAILFTDDLSGSGGGTASANITPGSFDMTVVGGLSDVDTLYLENEGDGVLIWSVHEEGGVINQADRLSRINVPLRPVTDSTPFNTHRDDDNLVDPFSIPITDSQGGPDDFGYMWKDSDENDGPTFDWFDEYGTILDTNTIIGEPTNDGYFPGVEIPFSFPFYGESYDEIFINVNGFLTFQSGLQANGSWSNRALPSSDAPLPGETASMISPWWDDVTHQIEGDIWVNTSLQDTVVITYDHVRSYTGTGHYTFQVLLISTGKIIFQYDSMGDARLQSSTIGIQNSNATLGFTIADNQEYMHDDLAIMIWVPSVWLEVLDDSGVSGPNEIGTSRIQVSGSQVPLGDYEGNIIVQTNDPDNQYVTIPITLHVNAGGEAPVVSDIQDQTVLGEDFEPINLDDFVEDNTWPDRRIDWTVTGNSDLIVDIVNRVLYVQYVDGYSGSETLTLTATNPENLSDSDEAVFTVEVSDLEEVSQLPMAYEISELYPNPFNPTTSVTVSLPDAADIRMDVFDVLGRKVTSQVYGHQSAGYHTISWGNGDLTSGVYFFRIEAGPIHVVRKAVLMK